MPLRKLNRLISITALKEFNIDDSSAFKELYNLNNRKRDIRKFLNVIENSIMDSLKKFKISSYNDRKNIGISIFRLCNEYFEKTLLSLVQAAII